MADRVKQHLAKKVIESLRNSGQPPKLGALALNTGTDPILKALRERYLLDHCCRVEGMDGGGACKWVEADYGNGKTQLLRCVREIAWELDYVTAYVELSQEESPLDHPAKVFSAVSRSLQARPSNAGEVDVCKGLDQVLSQLLDRRFPGVLSGASAPDEVRRQAMEWVGSLRYTPVDSSALLTAASTYLTARLDGDTAREEIAKLYLRGEPVPPSELRRAGVFEKLDNASGFRLLRSVCQLLQRTGLAAGTVILFDEARRTLSLMSTKSQKKACENLLSVINACNNGDLPGTLFLYAVMPEFFANFATAYPALQQRCGPATRFNLNKIDGVKEIDLLKALSKRVAKLYFEAYGGTPPQSQDGLERSLDRLAETALRETMGTGTRRLLVKSCVQFLDEAREGAQQEMTESDASKLISQSREDLLALEHAEVESHGE